MDFLFIWGWVAATLGMTSVLPQLLHIVRYRVTRGLSLRMWQFNVACAGAWTLYGISVGHPQLQWPNAFFWVTSMLVVIFIARSRQLGLWRVLALPTALAVALFSVNLLAGDAAFGLAVVVPAVSGLAMQLKTMWVTPDISGVSVLYFVHGAAVQAAWLVWAIPMRESALIVAGSLALVLFGLNLAYRLYRGRRPKVLATA